MNKEKQKTMNKKPAPNQTKKKAPKQKKPNRSINLELETVSYDHAEDSERVLKLKEGMAPSSFERGAIDYVTVGNKYARSFYLEGFPDTVQVGYLTSLYDSDYDLDVSLSVVPRGQSEARKELQDKLTIQKAHLAEEYEKGRYRDRDTYQASIEKLETQIAELASKEERAFEAQLFFTLYADSKEELERHTTALIQSLKNEELTPHTFSLRQDKAWKTIIPYGIDYVDDKKRNFNTGAVVSSIPFYVPQLYDELGIYLGDNTFAGTPALLDLFKKGIQNSNLNVFGASGSGKSTLVKVLTARSALNGIRTVIIDPEGEYNKLTRSLRGESIKLSTDPNTAIMMNLFDVEESDELDTYGNKVSSLNLREKYEDVVGFIKVAYPQTTKAQEANLLEVLEKLYADFGFVDGDPKSLYENDDVIVRDGVLINSSYKRKPPQLTDFLNFLDLTIKEGLYPGLQEVYDALQPYRSSKSRGVFDTQTPKELQSLRDLPIINFDVSALENAEMRGLALYVLLSWVN